MNKLVNTIALVVMLYSIAVSTTHIVETSLMIGLVGWQAFTSPLLVDAVFLLGKLGRSKRYEDRPGVRKGALALMVFGGGLSLTCNLAAGANIGQRIHGVVVVVVMVWVESFAAKLVETAQAIVAMVPQADADAAIAAAIAIVQTEATARMAEIEYATRTAVVAELTARFDAEREAMAAAAAETAATRAQQRRNGNAARALAAASPSMKPAQLAKATGVSPSTAAKILAEVAATAPVSPGRVPVAELNASMAA